MKKEIVKSGKNINIIYIKPSQSKLTNIYQVDTKGNNKIGAIKWHGAWRRYVFCPSMNTLFDASCLDEISGFLMMATLEYKRNLQEKNNEK